MTHEASIKIETGIPLITRSDALALSNRLRAVSARQAAVDAGANVYAGKPCKNCGSISKYVSTRGCVKCSAEGTAKYRAQNPEHVKRQSRDYWLKTTYGITEACYAEMVANQNGKCPLCFIDLSRGNAHIDHCHATGNVRGVLCAQCNKGLGHFNDAPSVMIRAAAYVEFYKNK